MGISGELGAAKPAPRAYAGAADAVGLPAAQLAMVGDHLEWDVAGPLRAGFAAAVWLARDGVPAGTVLPQGAVAVATLAEVPAALGL